MKRLLLLAAVVVLMVIYVFKPFLYSRQARMSAKPEVITAVYLNVTGAPLCAKLYKLDKWHGGRPIASKEPIFLALPASLPSPEDGGQAYADNVFELTGFSYQFETQNKLTGQVDISSSHRFDLISWKVLPPYKLRKTDTADPNDDYEVSDAALSFTMKEDNYRMENFIKVNSVDCLN
ncbi:hypothetical protein [Bowmanella denitrificans]|uniref:hypothetical protein n=1 Tax=Bowmanella denitrificans TaxID=366582 RepID=UPI000C9B39EA|nr:hypothetical protein [Bowmanella denitrificans]